MPMNAADYARDWKSISRQIREQAGNRCEECGVANGAVGQRDKHGRWHDEDAIHGMNSDVGESRFGGFPDMTRIVLTVHHLCGDPACIDPGHLRALCQRCHLAYHRPAPGTIRRKRLMAAGQAAMELTA